MDETPRPLTVEVVYALPQRQWCAKISVHAQATVGDAIELSGFASTIPDVSINEAHVGIFGRLATLSTVLRDGDRIEIYRPLQIDPMTSRRVRAAKRMKSVVRSKT
jgi:putative ubiquitin-RnfH superfamily antitoxin RatB of RatAB toxin-antitoxin module